MGTEYTAGVFFDPYLRVFWVAIDEKTKVVKYRESRLKDILEKCGQRGNSVCQNII